MDKLKYRYIILLSLLIGILFSACNKDNWNKHNAITDPILTVNLLAQINKNPDLSTFSSYLVKTGYDKVVASSKTFTIWAPTNLALESLDPAIVNDTALLKKYVGYHISNQTYLTSQASSQLTIRSLNGKNILFTKTTFEEANIVTADRYVGNGVLHSIDMATPPKLNAWEYLNSLTTSLEKSAVLTQNYHRFDPLTGVVTGINPTTGLPIYKDSTGWSTGNYFLDRTPINNEDQKFTFVILTDDAYNTQYSKVSKYFTYNDPKYTTAQNLANTIGKSNGMVTKDLVIKGVYTLDILPDTLTSNDSVKFHLDKSAIVEIHKVSNGIVYVMSKINYNMATLIPTLIIKGERNVKSAKSTDIPYYDSYASNLTTSGTRTTSQIMTSYRTTVGGPMTTVQTTELYYYNHGKASYWVHYLPTVNTVTYKVYWVVYKTFINLPVLPLTVPIEFSQRLAFGTTALLPAFPYVQIPMNNLNEVYLGDYTPGAYGNLDVFLVGNTTTANSTNSLLLDHIKMVPILN